MSTKFPFKKIDGIQKQKKCLKPKLCFVHNMRRLNKKKMKFKGYVHSEEG
jgi:hypothetical protein